MIRSNERIPKLRARGRENRRRLLREAQRLMLEHPNEPIKFSDVFEAAGVSRGSAYRIYIGMDDLSQDIVTNWVNNFVEYLRSGNPEKHPEHWTQLSDFLIGRAADYWSETADTLRLLPHLRAVQPERYRKAVKAMSHCIVEIFEHFFVIPDVPHLSHRFGFYTEICDVTFADAVRTEGFISEERLHEAQVLGRTYLAFHLPARLPLQQRAS